jgi:hypothetical protein
MIRLFGGKTDHPMADPREAKRILGELPAQDAFKSLEELTHWLESVSAAEGFRPEARIQTLAMIDEAAQQRLRRLAREYFAAERPSRFQENRLWTALHGYWRQAGVSLARAVDLFVQGAKGAENAKGALPLLLVRTLRALAQQVKWMHLRYGPIDAAAWGLFNGVYAYAEVRELTQAKVVPYPGVAGESTPQLEFLKGAMFGASAPDCLLPREADFAERVIADFAPGFTLAAAPLPAQAFWTDLGKPMAPARASRAPASGPGVRFLGAGGALAEIEALIERVYTSGQVPSSLGAGAGLEPEFVLEVLRHLATNWSPQQPERRSQRHAVKSRLSVAHGYEGVIGALGGSGSLDFDAQGSESWIVENVSAGGFGAVVPQLKGDWLRVGAVLALQPEGGTNWVLGLVRRVNKTTPQQARVGVETLCRTPEVLRFGVGGGATASEEGVLMRNGGTSEARILLKPGVYAPLQNLETERGAHRFVYIPQGLAERGEDYDIARFREMVRES